MAKIKEWKGVGLYVVQAGVHSDEFYNTLGYLVDGIFDMKMIEEEKGIKRFFRVRTIGSVSHDTKWVPFIIRDDRTIELQLESEGKRDA
jgi:KaiC/GvpD/RAD55 family RecA-like ATPase